MFFTILTNVLITIWVMLCVFVYGYHYLVEVYLGDLPVSGQSPRTAHENVKRIIEKILKDAVQPYKEKPNENAASGEDEKRTYEDLLATAILNKVVANYQKIPAFTESVSSRTSKRHSPFDEDAIYRSQELDSTSISSLEEWMQSDSSNTSAKYVDRLSLTIQQQIEEVHPNDSDEELLDDSEYFRTSSSFSNDDCNWRLQKRRIHETYSPVPVPMFVPNPSDQAKVLIGDKEVDDTSDLSDAASDYGDVDTTPRIENLIVSSKMVIGGKNGLADGWDGDSSEDSGVKEDRSEVTEEEKCRDGEEPTSIVSITSNKSEKDTECVEKFFSFPRTVKTSSPDLNLEPNTPPGNHFEGTYGKKEREKWSHPVELQSNPYSKESIEKRIQSNQRYGRDYYARQASLPSGARNRDEEEKEGVFKAVPVVTEEEIEPVIRDNSKEDFAAAEVVSDSDLSLVHTYDVENSKVYSESPKIWTKVNTEGLIFDPSEDIPDAVIQPEVRRVWYKSNTEGLLHEPEEPKTELYSPEPKEEEPKKTWFKLNTDGLLYSPEPKTNEHIFKTTEEAVKPQAKPRKFVPQNKPEEIKTPQDTPPRFVNRKSDNTLIRKIYSDPTVLNFALSNRDRDQIPTQIQPTFRPIETPEPKTPTPVFPEPKAPEIIVKLDTPLSPTEPKDSLEYSEQGFSLEFSDESKSEVEPEISELKEKRLVANLLGAFSKSFPNLSVIPKKDEPLKEKRFNKSIFNFQESEEIAFVSVRDLKSRFESKNDNAFKDKPVHSLTARSISKQMREQLKRHPSSSEA